MNKVYNKNLTKSTNDALLNLITLAKLLDYDIELYHVDEDYSNSNGPVTYYFQKNDFGYEITMRCVNGKINYLETVTGHMKKPGDNTYSTRYFPLESEIINSVNQISTLLQ